MGFQSYPAKREEIYNTHLQEIANVKFTLREIDILSCILHNRGAKKIATLLDISSRTVTTHISNIMNKLRNNSRDHIIDIMQKSGKLQHIRLYYFNLLIETAFIKTLSTIKKYSDSLVYSIDFDFSDDRSKCFNKLSKYLSLAGINVMTGHEHNTNIYHIYFSPTNTTTTVYKENNIIIVLEKYDSDIRIDNIKYVDFTPERNTYLSILKLIELMVHKVELQKLIWEFQSDYQSLQNAWDGGILVDTETTHTLLTTPKIKKITVVIAATILTVILIAPALKQWMASEHFIKPTIFPTTDLALDPDIKAFLSIAQNHNFSANNILKEQMHKNNDLVKYIEPIVSYLENPKIHDYIHSHGISIHIVLDTTHSLHALSNYYMYNENDGEKARKLLLYTKNLLEHYVNNYSNVELDFDKMTKEEIYTELSILEDLPEMYARVIYSLGRTYIYQGNQLDAIPYLEISKYLGQRTGIFEEYLSFLNIINLTHGLEIEKTIKDKNYLVAQEKLINIIELYQKLRRSTKRYILDYTPNTKTQSYNNSTNDIYNQVVIGEKISNYYTMLLTISNDSTKRVIYLEEISRQFLGYHNHPGLLNLAKKVSPRKEASVYNTLGNIILNLHNASMNSKDFQKALISKLHFTDGCDLDIAEQLFDLSHFLSRTTDITKADAYHGLIKVYKKKMALLKFKWVEMDLLSSNLVFRLANMPLL